VPEVVRINVVGWANETGGALARGVEDEVNEKANQRSKKCKNRSGCVTNSKATVALRLNKKGTGPAGGKGAEKNGGAAIPYRRSEIRRRNAPGEKYGERGVSGQ